MDAHPLHAADGTPEIEAVLAHADWVRSLARRLARDPGEADDLAQETWLVFDARKPDTRRGLKPWLATVVRQLALRGRRDRARREQREHDVARHERTPSSAEFAADAELRALVGRALAELDEPFRSTLILRFFAGLEPAEIAAREGVPAATVRTRVKRGLDKLRGALDRACGDRHAWSTLFLRLLELETPPPVLAGPALGGLLAMTLTWKVAAGVAALALAGVFVWLDVGGDRAGMGAVGANAGETRVHLDAGAEPSIAVAEAAHTAQREQLAQPTSAPQSVTENAFDARVHARIVGDDGVPIVGASIAAFAARSGRDQEDLPCGSSTSDAHGEADFTLRREDTSFTGSEFACTFLVRKAGFATRRFIVKITEDARTEVGDVVLGRACVLRGRVESAEGAPLAKALVQCGPAAIAEHDPVRVRLNGPLYDLDALWIANVMTNADGSFELADATPGIVRVWGAADGTAWTSTEPLELRPGELRSGIVLRLTSLAREDSITGSVLTPDGKPFEGARVQAAYEWLGGATALFTRSDAAGKFVFRVGMLVPHELRVTDEAGRYGTLVRGPIAPGTRDYEARFAPRRTIELRVTSRGVPVTRFAARTEQHDRLVRGISLGALESVAEDDHANGVAQIVVPSSVFDVVIDAPGHEIVEHGPFDDADAPEFIACELAPLPGVRGRVQFEGVSADDVRVELLRWHGVDAELWKDGYRVQYGGMDVVSAKPASDGAFVLHVRTDGRYMVRARVTGDRAREFAPAELGPLDFVARNGADGLVLRIGRGGAIQGRVIVDAGENPAGRIVGLNHGDGEPRTVRTDADGRFRAEHLALGNWQVLPARAEVDEIRSTWTTIAMGPHGREFDGWTCKVASGETAHADVDMRANSSGTLDGQVRGLSGGGWSATLAFAETTGSARAETRSSNVTLDGRFHFEFARAGSHELRLVGPGEPGRALRLTRILELTPGPNSLDERVVLASLRGEGFVPAPTGVVYEYEAHAEFGAACRLEPDAEGHFEWTQVLAGRGAVNRYTPSSQPGAEAKWERVATFEVQPGAEIVVRAP